MISVILPVYNCEKFLRESIQSVLDQSYKDFEFIIINDGSMDRSNEIILSFKDNRIRYFTNEVNKGLIFTLNRGIKLSKREYIARMDADDISYPKRFEMQLDFLIHNPEYGVCGTLVKIINEENISAEIMQLPINDEEIKSYLYFSSPLNHPSIMIRKSILNKNLYSENYKTAEDYELWVRLSFITKFYNLPEVLMSYRIHDDNISKVNLFQAEQSVRKILRSLITPTLLNKSLVDIYLEFVTRSHEISYKKYNSWLGKFIKEPLFKKNYFKKYFIKRWFGLCLSGKNYKYILINNIVLKMPFLYYTLLIKFVFIVLFKGLPRSLKN